MPMVNYGPAGVDATPIIRSTKTAAYAAGFGELVPVNTTGGAVTITLPEADRVGQVTVRLASGTTAVTVARTGTNTIDGGTSASVALAEGAKTFITNGDGAWVTLHVGNTVAAMDTRYDRVVGAANTVAAGGATQTIPEPNVSKYNDITLTANLTLTLPAATAGKELVIVFRQDATGSRTVTWPAGTKFAGGSLTITATASAVDVVRAVSVVDGTWIVWREAAAVA